jgi:hypothetical protein
MDTKDTTSLVGERFQHRKLVECIHRKSYVPIANLMTENGCSLGCGDEEATTQVKQRSGRMIVEVTKSKSAGDAGAEGSMSNVSIGETPLIRAT